MNKQGIHVSISGQGPNLVLLHGWGLHGGIWETVLPSLEAQYTVHNIDMPGFGRSVEMLESTNLRYDLDFLLDNIGPILPEQCHLMGWSLGGAVATALALRYPDKVSKLVTVASSPCFVTNPEWPYAMDKIVLEQFIGYLKKDFRGTLIKFLSIQTMGSPTQKKDVAQLKETVFGLGMPAEKALKGGLDTLNDVNLLADLKSLSMPLLRLYGKLDTLVPVKSVELITSYAPNSEHRIYNKSGHAPFLSQTDDFTIDVLDFLNR